jgi:hypothetical protein
LQAAVLFEKEKGKDTFLALTAWNLKATQYKTLKMSALNLGTMLFPCISTEKVKKSRDTVSLKIISQKGKKNGIKAIILIPHNELQQPKSKMGKYVASLHFKDPSDNFFSLRAG